MDERKVVSFEEIILPIDYKVSPSLKLVVTDSHTYDIEACQNHKVSTKWSEEKVYPGTFATFSVTAQSDSLCAMSATDKSVELFDNNNKVTSETIGKLQAEIGDRKTSRIENYWEYQRKCPDTYDAIKVFESAGIQIVTDLSFVKSCETITDAVNVPEHGPEVVALSVEPVALPVEPAVTEELAFA